MHTGACEAESTHVHKQVRSFTHTHTQSHHIPSAKLSSYRGVQAGSCTPGKVHLHTHVHTRAQTFTTYTPSNFCPTAVCRRGRALLAKHTCAPTSTGMHTKSPHTLRQTFVLPQCASGVVHSKQSTPAHPRAQTFTTYAPPNFRPTAVCRRGRALLAKHTCTPTSTGMHTKSPHTMLL